MRYLLPTLMLMGGAFFAGAALSRAAADRRERERLLREDLNHALNHLGRHVADMERQVEELADLAHGHEGMVPAKDTPQPATA